MENDVALGILEEYGIYAKYSKYYRTINFNIYGIEAKIDPNYYTKEDLKKFVRKFWNMNIVELAEFHGFEVRAAEGGFMCFFGHSPQISSFISLDASKEKTGNYLAKVKEYQKELQNKQNKIGKEK